ncbi:hypothetical protein F4779DRAFT_615373 [Xylariaceae sp. FL0662B]|nr:hypothetical protein F4779DRAFT_615373 [Xylariaceae sp. FL0662B]
METFAIETPVNNSVTKLGKNKLTSFGEGVPLLATPNHPSPWRRSSQTNRSFSPSASSATTTSMESNRDDEEEEEEDDEEEEEEDEEYAGPDDPPLPMGTSNRTTVGVEFEFLLAACRSEEDDPDPHPDDGRWQSEKLVTLDDGIRFEALCKEQIAKVMRNAGIATTVCHENIRSDLVDLDEEDEEVENENDQALRRWRGRYLWNPSLSDSDNVEMAVETLTQQFNRYHLDNRIPFHGTRYKTLKAIADGVLGGFLLGAPNDDARNRVSTFWEYQGRKYLDGFKKLHREELNKIPDPNHVALPGLEPVYTAWSVTFDASVSAFAIRSDCYNIPPGSVQIEDAPSLPPLRGSARLADDQPPPSVFSGLPPGLYEWFGGEVRSPVYDINHPETMPMIQKVCAALRDNLRIHKPMSKTKTGLHIHFGQEAGWTLLHLKKLSTLWILLEEYVEHLHRKDRATNSYCVSVRDHSQLVGALQSADPREAAYFLSNLRSRSPEKSAEYLALLNSYVQLEGLPTKFVNILTEIWQFTNITKLAEALYSEATLFGSVRWRLGGVKRTDPISFMFTQTIEMRLMQGTLDANHVRRWMTVCARMILFARDSTPEQFRAGIQAMLRNTMSPADVMGIPQEDMDWLLNHIPDDEDNGYFEYVDKDIVNWGDPFMAPGYGNTHLDDPLG